MRCIHKYFWPNRLPQIVAYTHTHTHTFIFDGRTEWVEMAKEQRTRLQQSFRSFCHFGAQTQKIPNLLSASIPGLIIATCHLHPTLAPNRQVLDDSSERKMTGLFLLICWCVGWKRQSRLCWLNRAPAHHPKARHGRSSVAIAVRVGVSV